MKKYILLLSAVTLTSFSAFSQFTRVTDICEGLCGSNIQYPIVYKNVLYFQATSSTTGKEFWKYTAENGASLVQDLYTGTADSNPENFFIYNDLLYFTAYDGASYKLFSYDGTTVSSLFDYETSSFRDYFLFKNKLYLLKDAAVYSYEGVGIPTLATHFSAMTSNIVIRKSNEDYLYFVNNSPSSSNGLYRYDGSSAPVDLVISQSGPLIPAAFFNDYFYYIGNDPTTSYGRDLWRVSHTGSPELACDINPSGDAFYLVGGGPDLFITWGDSLYFSASTNAYGMELNRSNGTQTTMIADLNTGAMNAYPSYFTLWNDELYFLALDLTYGSSLWKYDRISPPVRLSQFSSNSTSSASNLMLFNDALYMVIYNTDHGTELWKYDGSSNAYLVEDVASGDQNFLRDQLNGQLIVFNNTLYMAGNGDDGSGEELWHYHPTITAVDDSQTKNQTLLYPNPLSTGQTLQVSSDLIPEEIVITNAQGLEVYRGKTLPVLYSPGLYQVQITSQEKKSVQKLWVH